METIIFDKYFDFLAVLIVSSNCERSPIIFDSPFRGITAQIFNSLILILPGLYFFIFFQKYLLHQTIFLHFYFDVYRESEIHLDVDHKQ